MADRVDARRAAELVLAARHDGEPVAVVTAVSGPQAGARVVVYANGAAAGTLGSAGIDEMAFRFGLDVLGTKKPALHRLDQQTQLFCEPFIASFSLVIAGAGHIAVPLASVGTMLGFDVTVLDDREEFATDERFARGVRVLRTDFTRPFEQIGIDECTFVVLVTRAHEFDYECLQQLLVHHHPLYIGMIGSRRRVRATFHALLESGLTPEQLARVRAPVGLDVGAETPAEIAVSIAAELVQVRSGRGTGAPLFQQERVLERFFSPDEVTNERS